MLWWLTLSMPPRSARPRTTDERTTVMLNLFKRSAPRNSTIREALVHAGLLAAADPARVAVVEKHGDYVGRPVNFFTAFEPHQKEVLLASGHVEQKGMVVITYRPQPDAKTPTRVPA